METSLSLVIVLRLVHILTGVCWAGAVVFIAAFLLPAMKAAGPAASPVMAHLTQVMKLPAVLLKWGLLTVASGLALFWRDATLAPGWMQSGPGRTFSLGAALGIIVVVTGMTVNLPTARRLGALAEEVRASGGVPSAAQAAEMQRLQERLARAMSAAAVLLLAAAAAMAVARHVPP